MTATATHADRRALFITTSTGLMVAGIGITVAFRNLGSRVELQHLMQAIGILTFLIGGRLACSESLVDPKVRGINVIKSYLAIAMMLTVGIVVYFAGSPLS